ncbi:uncharacterized protein PSFLO_03147 [Pseudozyma flocculosa]|uniref:Uncharacterized protein n=1 Tax=Pseudozyma flocculosa TaxID=84751 RepID=A0A5C3F323_9BASI|nr:uncharacterized protein PSFLO_03147 [Pseudozyma flocculosa]
MGTSPLIINLGIASSPPPSSGSDWLASQQSSFVPPYPAWIDPPSSSSPSPSPPSPPPRPLRPPQSGRREGSRAGQAHRRASERTCGPEIFRQIYVRLGDPWVASRPNERRGQAWQSGTVRCLGARSATAGAKRATSHTGATSSLSKQHAPGAGDGHEDAGRDRLVRWAGRSTRTYDHATPAVARRRGR